MNEPNDAISDVSIKIEGLERDPVLTVQDCKAFGQVVDEYKGVNEEEHKKQSPFGDS
jgi:hypothetical protein